MGGNNYKAGVNNYDATKFSSEIFKEKLNDNSLKLMADTISTHISMEPPWRKDEYLDKIREHSHLVTSNEFKNLRPDVFANAVRYCMNKCIYKTSAEAWRKSFPDRHKAIIEKHKDNPRDSVTSIVSRRAYLMNSTAIVKAIDLEMSIPASIKWSSERDEAMDKLVCLMRGESAPYKAIMYEKDDNGVLIKDEYGRRIPIVDDNGEIVTEDILQSVSPKIQMDAASKIIDATTFVLPPTSSTEDIEKQSLEEEKMKLQRSLLESFKSISAGQVEAMKNGANINDVQAIGRTIEADILGIDEKDIEEDDKYD